MKSVLIAVGVAGLLLGLVSSSWAHGGGRIYPIFELTDEDVATLDLKEGFVEDWLEIVGDPTLTALDFTDIPISPPYDPVDFDFRLWLAWHNASNRIYIAMQQADDIHYIDEEENQRVLLRFCDGSINFFIDGDHSAEDFVTDPSCCETEEEFLLLYNQWTQWYVAIGGTYSSGPRVRLWNDWQEYEQDWFQVPPYADGGGGVAGENPTIVVTEFYLTPFDRFVWNSPEESLVSELDRGKVIGFHMGINDQDPEDNRWGSYVLGEWVAGGFDETFVHGILVGPGGEILDDSAVESITWGRIKATFVR